MSFTDNFILFYTLILVITREPISHNYYILTLKGKNLTALRHLELEFERDLRLHLADSVRDVSNHQLLRLGQYSLPVGEVSQK